MEKSEPMLIPLLAGGLGNQLFQIAATYAFSRETKVDIMIKKGLFVGCGMGCRPEKYHNTIYSKFIVTDETSTTCVKEHKWIYHEILPEIHEALVSHKIVLLDGYWQSEKYFEKYKGDLINLLRPTNVVTWLQYYSFVFSKYPELYDTSNACFIGVRRGDYIDRAHIHNPCGMDYYRKAMEKVNAQVYYIASTDMDWCKKNFVGDQYKFLEIENEIELFYTMMLFQKYIISNSSFYWWGSYLSIHDNPIVIAPDKWMGGKDAKWEEYYTIYRPEMVVVEREIEV